MPEPDRLVTLLEVLRNALKEAIPEVEGRICLSDAIGSDDTEKTLIWLAFGGGAVEQQDQAPPTYKRTESIRITAVAKGVNEEAHWKVLRLREKIRLVMRELQCIPNVTGSLNLIDEITPTEESALTVQANGDQFYVSRTLTYEATYVTDEGTPGEAGAGIPAVNVLAILKNIDARWRAERGGQRMKARDRVKFEEETE